MSKYLGAKFKMKNKLDGTEEIWEVTSYVPSSWSMEDYNEYTMRRVLGHLYGDTIEVLHKDIDDELAKGTFELIPPADQNACWHVWETYTGFTRIYSYCSKCDKKDYGNDKPRSFE